MADKNFHDYVVNDVMRDIPGITSRAMFGGYGIYRSGVFFAIIEDGKIWLRVDDSNKGDFEEMGSNAFTYSMKDGRIMTMAYWDLPEEILENREELEMWVEKSVQAAIKSKKKK